MVPLARKRFGVGPKLRPSKVKYHTFDDHRGNPGNPAIMSWDGVENGSNLPDLPPWIFYMVNPEIPRDFDGCAFASVLDDRILYSCGSFRYEFFFLPGATAEECVAHYRGELAARGTIWHQVRKLERAWKKKHGASEEAGDDPAEKLLSGDNDEPHFGITSKQGLPGLPWPKQANDWYFTNYRNWLFMYLDADVQWGLDQDHNVYLVQFDPMPIEWEEGARVRWDPMEHPIRSRQMQAMSRLDDEEALTYWMCDRSHDNWARTASEVTNDAKNLGWEIW